jgi:serine protease Do
VVVYADSRNGSGTIIAQSQRNTYILTCEHVISGAKNLTINYRDGKRFITISCAIEAVDEKHDLAILRTAKKIKGREPLPIAREEPELYEGVYLMGAPEGYHGTAAHGILTSMDGSNGRKADDTWQITGLASGGISGGIVSNIDCELIGVMSAVARDGHLPVWNIGFAVPLKHIKRFFTRTMKNRSHIAGKAMRCQ